jgi:hypothetical protein
MIDQIIAYNNEFVASNMITLERNTSILKYGV